MGRRVEEDDEGMTGNTQIKSVKARRIWDSRGRPTVEVDVHLSDGSFGRAVAPAGASRGSREAVELRDNEAAFRGMGVTKALCAINGEIDRALKGRCAADQKEVDACLIELDGTPQKARLGGNATIAVSMAVAHAAAHAAHMPLWRHLLGAAPAQLPMPMIQIFGGGAHASRRIDVQDFLIIPVAAQSFDEATAIAAEVYRAAGELMAERGLLRGVADEGGWWPEFVSNEEALDQAVQAIERAGYRPGEDVALALDVAASQLRKLSRYQFAADRHEMDSQELVSRIVGWCHRYPIISVEDPVGEDDDEGMRAFTAATGDRIQVIGDDYLVTSAARVRTAARQQACNAVLLKPNQAGTITETRAALDAAREAGWRAIVSARSGETEDVTIVHLAVGWRAEQLKVGSFSRSERMAKWNEGIRIEEALGPAAAFIGSTAVGGTKLRLAAK
jgi:enolase 1/2/3